MHSLPLHADQPLAMLEEAAFKAAVDRVAPAVVRIETIGGLERVEKVLIGAGPTTGLVATADGYIVSSAFNFIQKPTSILVTLAGGTRLPARLVATDRSRMLVLLKVEPPAPLAVPEAAGEKEIRIGQWSVAVGRTFEGAAPNISVGIVSAVRRIWGKAIQTDAKISPSNYGGPLVDLRGRVLGVLVPMTPTKSTVVAGMEWYDSGIGFAIPWEHVQRMLPRWKDEDLHAGQMGIGFKAGNQFANAAQIATCRVNSPAMKADLKPGDVIVQVEGQEVVRQSQVKELVSPRYAGETIRLVVLRGEERLEREITLVAEIEPYAHPFLGFLPRRDPATQEEPLAVRYVYPNSPAEKAGLRAGDVITAFGNALVTGRADLADKLGAMQPGSDATVTIARGGASQTLTIHPGSLPGEIPSSLPPAWRSRPAGDLPQRPAVGRFEQKAAEYEMPALVYVNEAYRPDVPQGVVIHLSADGSYDADELIANYKPLCDAHDLILLAPQTEPPDGAMSRRWNPTTHGPYIGKLLAQLAETYAIDRTRVAVHGYQGGGAMGLALAASHRDWIRGVASVGALNMQKPPDNEPQHRLAYYFGLPRKGPLVEMRETVVDVLQTMKYPVTVKELGDELRPLNADELGELVRWIDTLDRL